MTTKNAKDAETVKVDVVKTVTVPVGKDAEGNKRRLHFVKDKTYPKVDAGLAKTLAEKGFLKIVKD